MARKKPLSDQVVVVAGGPYGLGRAIVRAVADRGAKVVAGARSRETLDNAVAEVEAAGSEAIAVETDVTQRDQDPGAHGRFDDQARESTAWTWLRPHGGKPALIGLGATAVGVLVAATSCPAHGRCERG